MNGIFEYKEEEQLPDDSLGKPSLPENRFTHVIV